MTFSTTWSYINHRAPGYTSLGEMYGTDHFCLFLSSVVRMQRPNVIVELGTGSGVTSLMAAEALKHNNNGHIWTVDDGSHWVKGSMRHRCQAALGYEDMEETYAAFIDRLIAFHDLTGFLTPVTLRITGRHLFAPDARIDMVFADATSSGARGCSNLLQYYLPKMTGYSSIFIDRASTVHHSFLLLNHIIERLNVGRIPAELLAGICEQERQSLRELVERSSFSIVHLTETALARKTNPTQNSRAWIRIEPSDYVHHNDVSTYM